MYSQKDQKLVFNTNYHLMQAKSIAENKDASLRSLFCVFLSGCFTQVLLYVRREGSGKTDHMPRLIRALATCGCNKYLNLM